MLYFDFTPLDITRLVVQRLQKDSLEVLMKLPEDKLSKAAKEVFEARHYHESATYVLRLQELYSRLNFLKSSLISKEITEITESINKEKLIEKIVYSIVNGKKAFDELPTLCFPPRPLGSEESENKDENLLKAVFNGTIKMPFPVMKGYNSESLPFILTAFRVNGLPHINLACFNPDTAFDEPLNLVKGTIFFHAKNTMTGKPLSFEMPGSEINLFNMVHAWKEMLNLGFYDFPTYASSSSISVRKIEIVMQGDL